jgi:hypothetical protein
MMSGVRPKTAALSAGVLLTLIGSARIISTYKVFNFTIDEPQTSGRAFLSLLQLS